MRPDVVTFTVMIDILCKDGKMDEANCLLEMMIQRGVNPCHTYLKCVHDGFCLVGRISHSRELFVSLESNGCRHDVFSCNILINGFCMKKKVDTATSLYREMLSKGIRPARHYYI